MRDQMTRALKIDVMSGPFSYLDRDAKSIIPSDADKIGIGGVEGFGISTEAFTGFRMLNYCRWDPEFWLFIKTYYGLALHQVYKEMIEKYEGSND